MNSNQPDAERCYAAHIFRNSAWSRMRTPNWRALSNFEPASAPARTKSVFLLTLPLTLPPAASIRAVASSRVIVGKRAGQHHRLAGKGARHRRSAAVDRSSPRGSGRAQLTDTNEDCLSGRDAKIIQHARRRHRARPPASAPSIPRRPVEIRFPQFPVSARRHAARAAPFPLRSWADSGASAG